MELNVVEDREGEHKRYRSLDPVHAQTLFLFSNLFIKILNVKRYRSLDPMLRPCVCLCLCVCLSVSVCVSCARSHPLSRAHTQHTRCRVRDMDLFEPLEDKEKGLGFTV